MLAEYSIKQAEDVLSDENFETALFSCEDDDHQTIWESYGESHCRLVVGPHENTSLFQDVCAVRGQTDDRWAKTEFSVDRHADHYCFYVDDSPVGCLAATRATRGPLDCEEFLPQTLLAHCRDVISSAGKFRILPEFRMLSSRADGQIVSRTMVREVWRHQIRQGIRLDLMTSELRYVPYYRRLGYVVCEGYQFEHPTLKSSCEVMMLAADAGRPSIIQSTAKEEGAEFSLAEVMELL